MASSFTTFLDHTLWRTTIRRTPLDEWSARSRDPHLTTNNTHNRQTYMPLVGFEPTISASERPQTHALDRAPTGTGIRFLQKYKVFMSWIFVPSYGSGVDSHLSKYSKYGKNLNTRNGLNSFRTVKLPANFQKGWSFFISKERHC